MRLELFIRIFLFIIDINLLNIFNVLKVYMYIILVIYVNITFKRY
jgi:hypothetical protein